ncbi:MAG TPA: hypothetical protein ENJ87_06100 [Gammaproteobacteria bacterium]|nr:hypothetical protein [Gammaproteobacteria bacterium]
MTYIKLAQRMPLFLLLTTVIVSCGGGGDETASPISFQQRFAIEGQVDLSEFSDTITRSVELKDNLGTGSVVKTSTLRWGIMNDDKDIYIAAQWTDDSFNHDFDITTGPVDFDGIKLLIDDDGNGTLDNNDDERTVIAANISSQYIDQHVTTGDETDLIGDGLGRLSYDAATQTYSAEFLFPLTSDAANTDGDLSSDTRYNIVLFDNTELALGTGNAGTAYNSDTDSSAWPALPITTAVTHQRPEIPTGLTGLIAFISEHDVPVNGEIYLYDPATGITTRVTNLPNLFKDNISLSHDRSKISFHGSPDKNDATQYEIYTVDSDGLNLQQLTNNTILDGHPAWSLDDTRIAYASFRTAPGESLITMTAAGVEIDNLTPAGKADNDPDYLPDGRIIFKTDRFNASPKVQIAVMNENGSAAQQVTKVDNVSDHDPVGDAQFTIFERFPRGTAFNTDVDAGFIGWDIVEARLDGTGEQTLLTDGWVNWLPVYDPTGQYIAYQKSTGSYTDVRLMTRQGSELGRLIPGITKIRYIDWK